MFDQKNLRHCFIFHKPYFGPVLAKLLGKSFWHMTLYILVLIFFSFQLHQTFFMSVEPPSYVLYSLGISYVYPKQSLPEYDYQHLINITNFTFTMLPKKECTNSTVLLVLVHSSPSHFAYRKMIRRTWGQARPDLRVNFAIGIVENPELNLKIQTESLVFGDLLQGSFVDSYRNMTYKHTMVLKYPIYHCPQAKYILKTDDDVFVNTELLMNFLVRDLSPFGASGILFCSLIQNAHVMRSYRSKWRVSFREYKWKTYPDYCLGYVILYSTDVVFGLYQQVQKSPYFWIDDLHVTGTAVKQTHFIHTNLKNLILTRKQMLQIIHKPHGNRTFLFGSSDLKEDQIAHLWAYSQTQNNSVLVFP